MNYWIEWHTVMLHLSRHSGEFAPVKRDAEVDLGQDVRQDPGQGIYVAGAVVQGLLALFRREWWASHYALLHRVLALDVDSVEPEISQQAYQPFALRRVTPVG